jgi:hypothetical protein
MRMPEERRLHLIFLTTGAAVALFLHQSAVRAQASSGPTAFADQLRQVELGRDRALVTGDRSYLDRVIADDYHLVSPFGTIDDKAAEVKSAGSGFYLSLTPGPIAVRRAGKDAAILRYQIAAVVRLRSGPYHASYWHTDYYELRNGQWQVVWSQSTEIKQAATPPPASMQKGAADG